MSSSSRNSTNAIYNSLNLNVPDNNSEEKEGALVRIPQKCYGYITPETPKHIKGLYTEGLNTCSGVTLIAHDTNNEYCFLYHADDETNLADKSHGIPN
jgi:hypothetical protein